MLINLEHFNGIFTLQNNSLWTKFIIYCPLSYFISIFIHSWSMGIYLECFQIEFIPLALCVKILRNLLMCLQKIQYIEKLHGQFIIWLKVLGKSFNFIHSLVLISKPWELLRAHKKRKKKYVKLNGRMLKTT